jgi:hypothetical protein
MNPKATSFDDYYAPVRRGLFRAEHFERMGLGIWVFGYFLTRVPIGSDDGKIHVVFNDEEIGNWLGMSTRNVRKYRQELVKEEYLSITQTRDGYRITVNNWHKDTPKDTIADTFADICYEENPALLSNKKKRNIEKEKEEDNIYTNSERITFHGGGIIYEPCDEEGNPIKEKKKKEPKEPTHPAIVAFRRTTGRYPPKTNYDWVIDILGDSPDELKLHECKANWDRRGYNGNSLKWVEWYRDGIPKQGFKKPDNAFATPEERSEYKEWEQK